MSVRRNAFFSAVIMIMAVVIVVHMAVFVDLKRARAGCRMFFMTPGDAAAGAHAESRGQECEA